MSRDINDNIITYTDQAKGAGITPVLTGDVADISKTIFGESDSNAWTDGSADWETLYVPTAGEEGELYVLVEEDGDYDFYYIRWEEAGATTAVMGTCGDSVTAIQTRIDSGNLQIAQAADPNPNTLNAYTRIQVFQ